AGKSDRRHDRDRVFGGGGSVVAAGTGGQSANDGSHGGSFSLVGTTYPCSRGAWRRGRRMRRSGEKARPNRAGRKSAALSSPGSRISSRGCRRCWPAARRSPVGGGRR